MTRQNLIPAVDQNTKTDDVGSTLETPSITAFIPLWDLINHEDVLPSTLLNPEDGMIEFYANKDYKKGEELKNFYGKRSSFQFLLHNGFVHSQPEFDFLHIRLGISQSDRLYSNKCALLDQLNISGIVFELHRKQSKLDSNLIAFLRIFHMVEDDFHRFQQGPEQIRDNPLNSEAFVSLDQKGVQYLRNRARLLLTTYNRKDAKDAEQKTPNSDNIRKLLQIEQEILNTHAL